jgi:hypothetical protein
MVLTLALKRLNLKVAYTMLACRLESWKERVILDAKQDFDTARERNTP